MGFSSCFIPVFYCADFQIFFIFNFDYTTFGLVSLSLGSNVCNPFICNSTEIGLLNCKSDHGIPLAKCQWLPIAFHLKTQAPYCGIKVFSDLIPFCPLVSSRFLAFLCSCSYYYRYYYLPPLILLHCNRGGKDHGI